MNTRDIFAALLLAAALPLPSFASPPRDGADASTSSAARPLSEGTVRKVDAAAGRITIAHGPLANLDMPAMTMSFSVPEKGMLKDIKPGDRVRFRAEQRDGKLFATQLMPDR